MALAVLLQTSRVAAEATVERLRALEIDAHVIDRPNALVKLASGGNYRVRVAVPEGELERARTEIARLDLEARPRVQRLAREVQAGLLLASAPAAALGLWLATRAVQSRLAWGGVAGLWLLGLGTWILWSRRGERRADLERGTD